MSAHGNRAPTSPRLLICGFSAFPAAPRNPAQAVVERLRASRWAPENASAAYRVLPVLWAGSAEAVEAALAEARFDGVLLIGVATRATAFRLETVGRNAASPTQRDHAGALWPRETISAEPGAELACTAPVDAMLSALHATGLPVERSADAGDYLCNFTLYRTLRLPDAPPTGFLHVPQARECAAGSAFGLDDIETAVRAVAETFATVLVPQPAALHSL